MAQNDVINRGEDMIKKGSTLLLTFVPMKLWEQYLVIAAIGSFGLVVTLLALFNQTIGSELVIPAFLFTITVFLLPFLGGISSRGWFYPIIFFFVSRIHRLDSNSSYYYWRVKLPNYGLPGYSPEQLAQLLAYGLLLMGLHS